MDKLFRQFVLERQYVKSVTPQTLTWYETSWKQLGSRITDLKTLPQVIVELRQERPALSEITINTYARCINAFLRWCFVEEHIPKLYIIPRLQEVKAQRQILSGEDISKIKLWKPTGINDRRVKVMTLIALDTGLRLTEIINIKKSDVDLESLLIKTLGKGRKYRSVPISIFLLKTLFKWMDGELLFATRNGKLISRPNAQRDIGVMGKKLDIKISFHRCRHTMATTYLRSGGSLATLRRILGHSSIETTQLYEHLETSDLVNNFSNLSTLR